MKEIELKVLEVKKGETVVMGKEVMAVLEEIKEGMVTEVMAVLKEFLFLWSIKKPVMEVMGPEVMEVWKGVMVVKEKEGMAVMEEVLERTDHQHHLHLVMVM